MPDLAILYVRCIRIELMYGSFLWYTDPHLPNETNKIAAIPFNDPVHIHIHGILYEYMEYGIAPGMYASMLTVYTTSMFLTPLFIYVTILYTYTSTFICIVVKVVAFRFDPISKYSNFPRVISFLIRVLETPRVWDIKTRTRILKCADREMWFHTGQ